MEDGRDNELVIRLIAYAATAGACRVLARREPEAARGLLIAAANHSARAATLASEICAEAGRANGRASTRFGVGYGS